MYVTEDMSCSKQIRTRTAIVKKAFNSNRSLICGPLTKKAVQSPCLEYGNVRNGNLDLLKSRMKEEQELLKCRFGEIW